MQLRSGCSAVCTAHLKVRKGEGALPSGQRDAECWYKGDIRWRLLSPRPEDRQVKNWRGEQQRLGGRAAGLAAAASRAAGWAAQKMMAAAFTFFSTCSRAAPGGCASSSQAQVNAGRRGKGPETQGRCAA